MCFGTPSEQLVGKTTKGPKHPMEAGVSSKVKNVFFSIIIKIILGRRTRVFDVCNDDVKKLYKDSKDRND